MNSNFNYPGVWSCWSRHLLSLTDNLFPPLRKTSDYSNSKIRTVENTKTAANTVISIDHYRLVEFVHLINLLWTKGHTNSAPLAPVPENLLIVEFTAFFFQILFCLPVIIHNNDIIPENKLISRKKIKTWILPDYSNAGYTRNTIKPQLLYGVPALQDALGECPFSGLV